MNLSQIVKATIIRSIFVAIELIVLAIISIIIFLNDGASPWGYWGAIAIVFITLSPIFVYVIASVVFNAFNLIIVLNKKHTVESIKKYYKISKAYFIWGIVTGGLYGCLLIPLFLLENIFLFIAYRKELNLIINA